MKTQEEYLQDRIGKPLTKSKKTDKLDYIKMKNIVKKSLRG